MGSNPVQVGNAALQVLPERMAEDCKDRVGEKDARGILGDFTQPETKLSLAQAGACDYVVESP